MLDIVLMCGGSGTRLWPLSRDLLPKQFINLTGSQTMFQLTCHRIKNIACSTLLVVCKETHQFIVKQQLEESGVPKFKIICEPEGRNTAAVIAASCALSNADTLLVLSSDHLWDDAKFVLAVEEGLSMVHDHIVVFGIKPTYPETGFGYIKCEGTKVLNFVEKPSKPVAEDYLAQGTFLWNSGIFLFDKAKMVEAFVTYAPDILEDSAKAIKATDTTGERIMLNKEAFSVVRSESIDYAVMEHLTDARVVKYEGKWTDIGSFKALFDEGKKDENNNSANKPEKFFALDSTNTFVHSTKIVTTIGVDNLAIVDTKDALLIANIDKSQDIKTMVSMLKHAEPEVLVHHTKVYRPWGWYDSIEGDDYAGYKVKRICVYPHKRLSLQSHAKRSEHWVIIKGTLKVRIGDDYHILHKNQSAYIPLGVLHRAENMEEEEAELIETQIGEYLGEDDIVRYEDDWGRKEIY